MAPAILMPALAMARLHLAERISLLCRSALSKQSGRLKVLDGGGLVTTPALSGSAAAILSVVPSALTGCGAHSKYAVSATPVIFDSLLDIVILLPITS